MTEQDDLFTGARRVFWGYFFLLLDFNLNFNSDFTIPLLPNFIGWIFLWRGVDALSSARPSLELLTLNALALLKLSPGLTGLVAAGLVMGAGALTGKHRNTPLTRYRLPPGKTTGALQPNADHALGRKAPEVFSAREEGADRFRPGTPWGMPRRLCSAIQTPPPSHRKLSLL